MAVVLASASPRRKELLTLAGIEYKVKVSGCDEAVPFGTPADEAVKILSHRKAYAVLGLCEKGDVVIAADTVVAVDGDILGKPADEDEAYTMLSRLSGRRHTVYTGVTITDGERDSCFSESTEVVFYELTDAEKKKYIATGEPFDKAGGYGIQGRGCVLVEKIDGDYFNVMGLPVAKTVRELDKFTK